jgi:hypothetical protein
MTSASVCQRGRHIPIPLGGQPVAIVLTKSLSLIPIDINDQSIAMF